MGTVECDRKVIKDILSNYAKIRSAHGQIEALTVFDEENDHYLLMSQGWDGKKRVHSVVYHVDLVDGKFWIQCDNTDRPIAEELEQAGIAKDRIVLGFHSPNVRQYTDYAVA